MSVGKCRDLAGRRGMLALCLAVAAGAGFAVPDGLAHPGTVGVTWTGTVSRILQTRCVSCHGAGGDLPRLDDYEQARAAAPRVKSAAIDGHPRRWYALPGFGDFANGPALIPHEIETLAQWADGRAPHGEGAPPPAAREDPAVPETPSVVLAPPGKRRVVGAAHTFELKPAFPDEQWIRGWLFEPGERSMVIGAVMSLESGQTLGTWAPGDGATLLPEGVALRLPAGAAIRTTVYYRDPHGPVVETSRLGLYLSRRPRRELETMVMPCGSARLPRAIEALAIRPPVSRAMRSLSVIARKPNRVLEPLAWFLDSPERHTQTYRFRRAVSLPPGTAIDVAASAKDCAVELDYVAAGAPLAPRPDGASAPLPTDALAERWCPMHADVRASRPGVCHRCGMPLVPMRPRVEGQYRVDAGVTPARLRAGEPGLVRLSIREPGSGVLAREFEMVHDRPFHLFVVSDDLREFSHVHPIAQRDGTLTIPFTFTRAGAYRLYSDFLPVGGVPQMVARSVLIDGPTGETLAGPPSELTEDLAPKHAGGSRAQLDFESGPLVAGVPSLLAFTLTDAQSGRPIDDLEPLLGAWGHAFILAEDRATAVHSHPTTSLQSGGGPRIFFAQRFPRAGRYRIWVQFQRAGSIVTLPFTVSVAPA